MHTFCLSGQSTSSLTCGLLSHLPIAAPLTNLGSRMLFSSLLRWILSLSSIPWSIKEPMVIKGNLLLTPAMQLTPSQWNSPLPRTFPFFSRIEKKTPLQLPMSLTTPSSTICHAWDAPGLSWTDFWCACAKAAGQASAISLQLPKIYPGSSKSPQVLGCVSRWIGKTLRSSPSYHKTDKGQGISIVAIWHMFIEAMLIWNI